MRLEAERATPKLLIGTVAALVWLASALYMAHFGAGWHLDLRVYRDAATSLLHGGEPFNEHFTASALPFTYPPFALLCFLPLSVGPLGLIEALWWLLSSVALVLVLYLLLRVDVPTNVMHRRLAGRRDALVVAAGIAALSTLALEPVRSNMDYGQINLLLMALIAIDVTGRPSRWRGVAVGLAAAVKLTPLVYLALFVVQGERRATARGAVTFVAVTLLSWAVLPGESARYWLHEAFVASRTGPVGSVSNQSWYGLLHRPPFSGGAPVSLLFLVLALATLALGVYLGSRLVRRERRAEALLALALTELLISPISWSHHWSWLAVVPVVLVSLGRTRPMVSGLLVLLLCCGIVAPYWWVTHGALGDLASNSLVLLGAVTLVVWSFQERRGAPRIAQLAERAIPVEL